MQQSNWTKNISQLALILAIIGVAVVIGVNTMARWEWTDKINSVGAIISGGMILVLALALAVIALIISLFAKGSSRRKALIALILSGGLLGTLYLLISPGLTAPPLHDITTDLENTPEYQVLPLREDNLVPFPDVAAWRDMHRSSFPDIGPITVSASPAQVIEVAERLMEDRGWTLAAADPESGWLEATAYAGYMKFKDDVIIRATTTETGTRVDMRSTSQVGVGDLGYNAARVEEFMAALDEAL